LLFHGDSDTICEWSREASLDEIENQERGIPEGLQRIQGVVEKKNTMPILSNIAAFGGERSSGNNRHRP